MNRLLKLGMIMLVLSAPLLLTGCRNRIADFTVLSTKQVPLAAQPLAQVDKGKTQVTLTVIPIGGEPALSELINEALEKEGGDVLLDPRISSTQFRIPLIFGIDRMKLEGTAATTRPDQVREYRQRLDD